jgi:hypothetical protein
MALPIPKRYVQEINKIRNLSDSAVDELVNALANSKVTARAEEMATHIAGQVPSIPLEELNGIVDVIYSLYHVREYSEFGRPIFLRELVEGIREQSSPPIKKHELPRIHKRFNRLLSIDTLDSISKAITLQRDGERLYCNAKIVSDIRPIFGADVRTPPVAAAIVHTLKLGYHERGEHKEFFLLLDEPDLARLQKLIKSRGFVLGSFNHFLRGSNLPRLGA